LKYSSLNFRKEEEEEKKMDFKTLSLYFIYILCNSKSSTSIGEPKVKMD